jgi:hypothetical protein
MDCIVEELLKGNTQLGSGVLDSRPEFALEVHAGELAAICPGPYACDNAGSQAPIPILLEAIHIKVHELSAARLTHFPARANAPNQGIGSVCEATNLPPHFGKTNRAT